MLPSFRVLRDGSQHQRVSPITAPPSAVTNSANMPGGETAPQPPLKVVLYHSKISPFTGSDPSYSAHDFLDCCEAALGWAQVTDPKEKILFLKQQLSPGSEACNMMKYPSFRDAYEAGDYDTFRETFLSIFGEYIYTVRNLVEIVSSSVDVLAATMGSQDVIIAQVKATEFAEHYLRCLKAGGWFVDGQMTEESLGKFLVFLFYMCFVHTSSRLASLPLTFKPDERISTFAFKLRTRIQEIQYENLAAQSVAAVPGGSAQSSSAAPNSSQQSHGPRSPMTCTYCNRTGHTQARCYQRGKDKKKNKKATHKPSDPNPATTPSAPAASSHPAAGATKHCELHGSTNHTTKECFTINRLKNSYLKKRAGTSQTTTTPAGSSNVTGQPALQHR